MGAKPSRAGEAKVEAPELERKAAAPADVSDVDIVFHADGGDTLSAMPLPRHEWRADSTTRRDTAAMSTCAEAARARLRELTDVETAEPEDLASDFASQMGSYDAAQRGADRAPHKTWGAQCRAAFTLQSSGSGVEEWLQPRVALCERSVVDDIATDVLRNDELPFLGMLVQASGAGKTRAYHDLGCKDGVLVVPITLEFGWSSSPAFELLTEAVRCVHGWPDVDFRTRASVCVDLVVLFLRAHLQWTTLALRACAAASTGEYDKKRTVLRTWRSNHSERGAAKLFRAAVAAYDPETPMSALVESAARELRRTAEAFGSHSTVRRIVVAVDKIHAAMAHPAALYDSEGQRLEGVAGSLLSGLALAMCKMMPSCAFLACGTQWSITTMAQLVHVSPTGGVVRVYSDFGVLRTDDMVALLRRHFNKRCFSGKTRAGALADALAPLQGRPRWFFKYFLPRFLFSCQQGHCGDAHKWLDVLCATAADARTTVVGIMVGQVNAMLASGAVAAYPGVNPHGLARTEQRVANACVYAVLAGNGAVAAEESAVHALLGAAVACVGAASDAGDRVRVKVDFNDEPATRDAIRACGEQAVGNRACDPGFDHLSCTVGVDKGVLLEHYVQWALLRGCVRWRPVTLQYVLAPLVKTVVPCSCARLRVAVTCSRPSMCKAPETSLAACLRDRNTLLYKVESGFGPDLLMPVGTGVMAVHVNNTYPADFASAAKALQPAFAYRAAQGVGVPGGATSSARSNFEREWKKMLEHGTRGEGDEDSPVWIRAFFSAQPWSQDAVDLVNDYNADDDNAQWPVLLLDFATQRGGARGGGGDAPSAAALAQLDIPAGVKGITDAMFVWWGGLGGDKLLTRAEWRELCKERVERWKEDYDDDHDSGIGRAGLERRLAAWQARLRWCNKQWPQEQPQKQAWPE